MKPQIDDRWLFYGVTAEFLEERAAWLKQQRNLHGSCHRFFAIAGTLVAFSRHEYLLASVAFFQSLPGLERALKRYYDTEERKLKELLVAAAKDDIIHDNLFGKVQAFTDEFAESIEEVIGKGPRTHTALLVELLPELRNQYFHGTYLLAPDYLYLTFQVRQIADALADKRAQPGVS